MSFKHVKFEDSPIMRSLERVAREKGLVKPEPAIQKTAALTKKADLTPSSNLMENIFKLCEGLREKGRVKEAAEVETNYLNYKRAQTLYEAHTEKGEDLIHAAHPKGSHKLEGVEGDEATIEDILDQHLKIVQVIEKKPTGKLSTATQILRQVKRALGQDINKTLSDKLSLINSRVGRIDALTSELSFSLKPYVDIVRELTQNPTIDNLKRIQENLKMLRSRLDPKGSIHYMTFGMSGLSEDAWAGVQDLLNDAVKATGDALSIRSEMRRQQGQDEVTPRANTTVTPSIANDPTSAFTKTIDNSIAEFTRVKGFVTSDDPKDKQDIVTTQAWLDKRLSYLQALKTQFEGDPDKAAAVPDFQSKLGKIMSGIEQVKKEWL